MQRVKVVVRLPSPSMEEGLGTGLESLSKPEKAREALRLLRQPFGVLPPPPSLPFPHRGGRSLFSAARPEVLKVPVA